MNKTLIPSNRARSQGPKLSGVKQLAIAAALLFSLTAGAETQLKVKRCAGAVDASPKREVSQRINDFARLYRLGIKLQPSLEIVTVIAAEQFNGIVHIAGVKRLEVAKDKIRRAYVGDTTKIMDIARSAIVFEKLEDLEKAYSYFSLLYNIGNSRNYFLHPKPTGYRSRQFNIDLGQGYFGEIQLHLKPLFDVKMDKADALYREIRELKGREYLRPSEERRLHRLVSKHRRLYTVAWKKVVDGEPVATSRFP